MKKIILDTNFLIDCIRFKVDLREIDSLIDERYELFVPSSVLGELKKISGRGVKAGSFAKIVLMLIEQKKIKSINSKEKNTDKSIIEMADDNTIVATNDMELRERLKKLRTQTIYLRARKHLDII